MADPKKSMLAGVLEREKPQVPPKSVEPEADDVSAAEAPARSRGAASGGRARAVKSAKSTKPRTIHLPDDLFERLLVQAHRRDRTISEYVASLLDRHVPDHRVVRSSMPTDAEDAA